jgi:hypothetical protein
VIIVEKPKQSNIALVADDSASVNMWISGSELREGDIIRVINGSVQMHRDEIILSAASGSIERIGDFEMVFVETPKKRF